MSVNYVYIKDKDGNNTKMAADSFDSAMYSNVITYDPVIAAAIGMNTEEQAIEIRGEHALCSVVASACVVGSGYGVSASGTTYHPRLTATAGVALSGFSDSAEDAPAGAGALTLLVTGVGANFVEQYGVCTLSGVTGQPINSYSDTTAATATANWLGINNVQVSTVGASGYNAGTLKIGTDATAFQNAVGPTNGLSRTATYVVPASKTLYLKSLQYKLSAAGSIRLQYVNLQSGAINIIELETGAGAVERGKIDFDYAVKIPEKCKLEVWGYGAAGSIRVEVLINGLLKNNV